jgi:hypothetical protein
VWVVIGPPLQVTVIGLILAIAAIPSPAEVVTVVSFKGTVINLSDSQIADIFLDRASHYPGGGPAMPIDQTENSSAREAFYLRFTRQSAAQVRAYRAKLVFTGRGTPPKAMANGAEIKKFLAQHPEAIGYLEEAEVDASVRVVN